MEPPVENVQSYPRPPRLEPAAQRIRVQFAGRRIVDTQRALRVLETHHAPTYYIPPDDIEATLRSVPGRSVCEWKGAARYFDLVVDGRTAPAAAWSYGDPTEAFRALAGYVAIYAGRVDACFVGELRVEPQPGDFYGGWVTPNLSGLVKGGRGTAHW